MRYLLDSLKAKLLTTMIMKVKAPIKFNYPSKLNNVSSRNLKLNLQHVNPRSINISYAAKGFFFNWDKAIESIIASKLLALPYKWR